MPRLAIAAAAIFIALHGLVHWIGFAVPWRLITTESFTYATTALGGQLELGEVGARVVGALWLPVLAAFVVAAYGMWSRVSWSLPVLAASAASSLVLCVLALPAAIAGVVIDVAILLVVANLTLQSRSASVPTR
jgi:hypothetical protein